MSIEKTCFAESIAERSLQNSSRGGSCGIHRGVQRPMTWGTQRACRNHDLNAPPNCKSNAQRKTRCKTQSVHNSDHLDFDSVLLFRCLGDLSAQRIRKSSSTEFNARWILRMQSRGGCYKCNREVDFVESITEHILHIQLIHRSRVRFCKPPLTCPPCCIQLHKTHRMLLHLLGAGRQAVTPE